MDLTRRKRKFNRLRGTFSPSRFGMLALIAALIMGLVMPSAILAKDHDGRAHDLPHIKHLQPATISKPLAAGQGGGVHGQIVGGTPVSQGSNKFAVFIEVEVEDGFIHCGGSLIEPRFVLTAAHCVEDPSTHILFSPEQILIAVGKANLNDLEPENVFGIVDVSQHPDWDPAAFANDVAVLELDASVPSSVATPIQLIGSGDTHLDGAGQAVSVVGWGLTSGGGDPSDQLRKANLTVVSDATCDATFATGIDEASVICASAPSQTSCQGDSGGPLFATVTESAGHGKANRAKAHKQKDIKAEKKKHKKHKKHKKKKKGGGGTTPQQIPVQIGVVSFGPVGCGTGIPAGFGQVSFSGIHGFIDGVIN